MTSEIFTEIDTCLNKVRDEIFAKLNKLEVYNIDIQGSGVQGISAALGNSAASNATAGQVGSIYVIQDGTGSRTLSYNAAWRFPAGSVPVATTAASAVDLVVFNTRSATTIDAVMLKNFTR